MTGQYVSEGFLHRRSTTFWLLAAVFGLLLTIAAMRGWLFLGILLAMNVAISYFMRPFKLFYIGVEVNILSAALAGIAYGPVPGAVFGGISAVVNLAVMKHLTMRSAFIVPGYMLVGLLAPALHALSMPTLGVWLAIGYNLFVSLPVVLIMKGNIGKAVTFGVTNVVFNFFVFSTVGAAMARVI